MNLREYRQRYADFYNKIQTAKDELNSELFATQKEFDELYCRQQEIDKRWFAGNLDYIIRHREHFQKSGLGDIIIDFLLLYCNSGMVGGFAWGSSSDYKIRLKDLLSLWQKGFTYEGFPIISYHVIIHYGHKIRLEYVKNGHIEVVYRECVDGKNPLELPNELISEVKSQDISYKYPSWQTYQTIDQIRNVLEKKEK